MIRTLGCRLVAGHFSRLTVDEQTDSTDSKRTWITRTFELVARTHGPIGAQSFLRRVTHRRSRLD